ncbi:hypothetical protein NVP1188A_02 [Vibrio phage 1.188.A._10N.286.51.A6]|uniref:Uncharacterized protein n=6 Tax=Mukerjeevirus TaxID=2733146 RepID=A0A2I7REJ4_9CAUD|nr:hypothetical protein HOU76_gp68 [Vibrio phage 1.169.O._10N.261.52.B1]YP_009817461.1 hypothetical protein HOU77_gp02 [Vibrio phage 1.188.A._10N.286.51.A6]YP_009817602.1 hypothetical protein HOU79_gp02 [Vibrio phage 1.224.A._10N.261.48.B1]YP_009817687.1 hypothetical protein HOU80_gp02 [Vibrio phage 1.261.O._10N.286.51.A7]AUR93656.1 hypothetical protein NVP1188B_02 [Vibrio phage 1.188.B._10N.286.51.A6]AUR93742.1 hypothetical protein NVP1188C_02 [Vibrio phage 1.188.C._10N.286.51.A6]AUR92059.1 
MDYSFIQKVKMWLCRTFGHKFNAKEAWVYGGMKHNNCKRCMHVVSKKHTPSK